MHQRSTVDILRIPNEKHIYQSAFVFLLPSEIEDQILHIRKKNRFIDSNQLKPHLTILFLGNHVGKDMLDIYLALQPFLQRDVPFAITGIGFFVKDRLVTNIHFKVAENKKLTRIHCDALRSYIRNGFTPQSEYIGKLFYPHISIFDGIKLPQDSISRINYPLPVVRKGKLANPVFFLKRL